MPLELQITPFGTSSSPLGPCPAMCLRGPYRTRLDSFYMSGVLLAFLVSPIGAAAVDFLLPA